VEIALLSSELTKSSRARLFTKRIRTSTLKATKRGLPTTPLNRSPDYMMLSGHGLSRSELWSRLEDIELATLEWIWWLNNHRLLGPLGHIPPAEYEEAYYLRLHSPRLRETLNSPGLR
jgi:transposase InsO family protein